MTITKEQLKQCLPFVTEKNLSTFISPINKVMELYEINTPSRASAFLAQLAHESGSFKYLKEIASGEAYEGRKDLGNVLTGDGKRYKGRGLIQLTGRANYQAFKDEFNIDVITYPELLEQPYNATLVAGWFWHKRKLNALADLGTEEAFRAITRKINGGYNGYEDRFTHWKRCLNALIQSQ